MALDTHARFPNITVPPNFSANGKQGTIMLPEWMGSDGMVGFRSRDGHVGVASVRGPTASG